MKNKVKEIKFEENRWGRLFKRVFAFVGDWYISSVLLNLLIRILIIYFKLGDKFGDILEYNLSVNCILLISPLLVSFLYYVIVPIVGDKSSTLMMKLLRIEIIDSKTFKKAGFISLLKRFYLGSFIIQGVLYSTFNTFIQALARIVKVNNSIKLDYFIAIASAIVVCISCYLAIKDKKTAKTLQDRIADTLVIEVKE